MSLRSLVYVSRVCLCTQVREAEPDPKKKTFSPIVVEARVVSVIFFHTSFYFMLFVAIVKILFISCFFAIFFLNCFFWHAGFLPCFCCFIRYPGRVRFRICIFF